MISYNLDARSSCTQRSNARLLIHLEPRHVATAIQHPTPGAPGPQGPHLAIVQVLHGSQNKPGPLGNLGTHNVSSLTSCISLFSRWSSYGLRVPWLSHVRSWMDPEIFGVFILYTFSLWVSLCPFPLNAVWQVTSVIRKWMKTSNYCKTKEFDSSKHNNKFSTILNNHLSITNWRWN